MNTKNFRFHMPVAVHYGVGIAHNMTGRIRGERVMIVCDPFLYQSGVAEKLGGALEGKTVSYFSGIEPNPSTVSVDACAEAARAARAETVIGVGGGSAMDVAKVVACLVTNGGSIYDYYAGGTKRFGPRAVKLILIPTTAGTGSEVTNVGVYTNPRAGVKMPFVTDEFWADEALIDPEMTYSLPPAVTASTGMDAFCHAIEAYWNKESQPMCDFLAMGALKTILENIKAAYDHPDDTAARGAMITAALVAGVAFSQTRTTGIHAVSFPLTTEFHASHGAACSITLPAFIRAAKQGAAEKLRVLAGYDKDRDGLGQTLSLLREGFAQAAVGREADERLCNRVTVMQLVGAADAVERALLRAGRNVSIPLLSACMVEEVKAALAG